MRGIRRQRERIRSHMKDCHQGMVHVIGPEQGFTLPGITCICGDSHTSSKLAVHLPRKRSNLAHGAFGFLAFGIGTSEVEHVLATQKLLRKKSKNLVYHCKRRTARGRFPWLQYGGSHERLQYEHQGRCPYWHCGRQMRPRLIICVVGPWLRKEKNGTALCRVGKTLKSDDGAKFDYEISIRASDIVPTVGVHVVPIAGRVPDPNTITDPVQLNVP